MIGNDTSILLSSGDTFDYAHPERCRFYITDIARGLSNTCRFTGQGRQFYSVAQHSCYVSWELSSQSGELALWGLLHDASEAFMCDIPTPLKHGPWMRGYRRLERKTMAGIARAYSLTPRIEPPAVRRADREMYDFERELLFGVGDHGIVTWTPAEARRTFLDTFADPLRIRRGPWE